MSSLENARTKDTGEAIASDPSPSVPSRSLASADVFVALEGAASWDETEAAREALEARATEVRERLHETLLELGRRTGHVLEVKRGVQAGIERIRGFSWTPEAALVVGIVVGAAGLALGIEAVHLVERVRARRLPRGLRGARRRLEAARRAWAHPERIAPTSARVPWVRFLGVVAGAAVRPLVRRAVRRLLEPPAEGSRVPAARAEVAAGAAS
jgi:hypothetical protein